jgi:hypothetical protein
MTTHLIGQDKRLIFTPDRVAVENESGQVLASRENPRSAFRDQAFETPWDDLHVAYFNSYALWTYLTIPFLYCNEGFAVEFEGIAIPTSRRVFAYDENKHKVPAPVLVAIDISHVAFA